MPEGAVNPHEVPEGAVNLHGATAWFSPAGKVSLSEGDVIEDDRGSEGRMSRKRQRGAKIHQLCKFFYFA